MSKSYPPIPVVLEAAGLDNLQRFGTQWRIQKIREILSDLSCFHSGGDRKTNRGDKMKFMRQKTQRTCTP